MSPNVLQSRSLKSVPSRLDPELSVLNSLHFSSVLSLILLAGYSVHSERMYSICRTSVIPSEVAFVYQ